MPVRVLRLRGGDQHEAPVVARRQGVVEGAGRVLDGADQQVVQQLVVGERRLGERLAAPPAADQVHEAVDARRTARADRVAHSRAASLVEQVDDAGVEALVGEVELVAERVQPLLRRGRSAASVAPAAASRLRHRRAEPAGGAGDRDHPAVELAHAGDPAADSLQRRPSGAPATGSSFGLQLRVEEAERELVVADQVDELLRLLDLGQVAPLARPDASRSAGGT